MGDATSVRGRKATLADALKEALREIFLRISPEPDKRLFIKRDANTCEKLVLRISIRYGRYHEVHCHRRGRVYRVPYC